jgi:hypothetical protein
MGGGEVHQAALDRAGITVGEFALGQPSLDEVFMTLTGQPASSALAAAGSQTLPAGCSGHGRRLPGYHERIVITPTAVPATSAPAALPGLAATSRPDPPGAWSASVAFG